MVEGKKLDFYTVYAANPSGSLMLASDGKLYGMTASGGVWGAGLLFQYDYVNDIYIDKIDFFSNGINGYYPFSNNLIEIGAITAIQENKASTNNINVYPNPTNGLLTISSKDAMRKIEVYNIAGQILLSEPSTEKTHIVQLYDFAEGIYFVKVVYANGLNSSAKVIVTH